MPLQVLEWRNLSVHVPPMRVPELPRLLDEADAHHEIEAMRRAATPVRRRLLWASIYGSCHLGEGEGGDLDAFDTLMEARARACVRARRHAHAQLRSRPFPPRPCSGAAPAAHPLRAVGGAQRAACP